MVLASERKMYNTVNKHESTFVPGILANPTKGFGSYSYEEPKASRLNLYNRGIQSRGGKDVIYA